MLVKLVAGSNSASLKLRRVGDAFVLDSGSVFRMAYRIQYLGSKLLSNYDNNVIIEQQHVNVQIYFFLYRGILLTDDNNIDVIA